ncbi:MAG: hydroxymethylbilane synthase [Candidatus Omnitrophica bacterium]|nr:hydroxymethylbilane synthase [Candidatus Omnitrophota bacterium]
MIRYIKIGTRPSSLALKQVEEVKQLLPFFNFEVVVIKTKGDKDKKTPLAFKEGSDFFTYEIEAALLSGEIDLAVHSAKDLEDEIPKSLIVAALTKSISRADCLVVRGNFTLDTLPKGSRIGTSSKNRKQAILNYREDLVALDIRGDIEERLAQVDCGKYDAVVMAKAALIRLGLEKRISQIIPFSIIEPHHLQGRLAIQLFRKRDDLLEIIRRLNVN